MVVTCDSFMFRSSCSLVERERNRVLSFFLPFTSEFGAPVVALSSSARSCERPSFSFTWINTHYCILPWIYLFFFTISIFIYISLSWFAFFPSLLLFESDRLQCVVRSSLRQQRLAICNFDYSRVFLGISGIFPLLNNCFQFTLWNRRDRDTQWWSEVVETNCRVDSIILETACG